MLRVASALSIAVLCAPARGLQDVAGVAGGLELDDVGGLDGLAIPAGVFRIGQRVQVRDWECEEWRAGTVSSLQPFKVTPEGWEAAFHWKFVRPSDATSVARRQPIDAKVLDPLAALMPQLPDEPGCYVWMPSGCPKNAAFRASLQWHRDLFGEEHGDLSERACLARASSFNSWCGADDARVQLVVPRAPPAPTKPGCYVRLPTGCPKQNLRARNLWRQDAHGEEVWGAAESRTICETDRKRMFDSWCGTEDTDMLFVDKAGRSRATAAPFDLQGPDAPSVSSSDELVGWEVPELPAEPGCFVWMPRGCPKSPAFRGISAWKRDEYGEEKKGAQMDKKACQARAHSFNSKCGTTEAQMLFIAPLPPAPPTTPGCYVFHRSGCPKRSVRVRNEWQRDTYGEDILNAKETKEVCEVKRKRAFDLWCGVDDTAMIFLPNTVVSQGAADPAVKDRHNAEGEPAATVTATAQAGGGASESRSQEDVPADLAVGHATNASGDLGASMADSTTTVQDPVANSAVEAHRMGVTLGSQAVGQHITNLNGRKFQLRQEGSFRFLELRRDGALALLVRGRIEALWPCTLFVREVVVSGAALGEDILRIHTGSRRRDADTPIEIEKWQNGSWKSIANVSAASPSSRRDKSDLTWVMVALKSTEFEAHPVKVLGRNGNVGSHDEEGGSIDICAGDIVVRVSKSGSNRTPWLELALQAPEATAAVGHNMALAGLLARSEPELAWLEPTEKCAKRLGRNVWKARPSAPMA